MPLGNCVCKARRQRRTPKVCKALVKARRIRGTKPPGVEVWMLSSCFILQKLLNDEKTHRQSTAPCKQRSKLPRAIERGRVCAT